MDPTIVPGPPQPPDPPPPLQQQQQQHQKRNRVLLSCAPCRVSKLKCDRAQPCEQCVKKERVSECEYAPKPVKKRRRPAGAGAGAGKAGEGGKGAMAARLKRLEGMVREMMDDGGSGGSGGGGGGDGVSAMKEVMPGQRSAMGEETGPAVEGEAASSTVSGAETAPSGLRGHVVHGDATTNYAGGSSTTYFGATHCMAMLEDIEGLKAYIGDDQDDEDEESPDADETGTAELLLLSLRGQPRNREELLSELPERSVADRLITRYFSSMSPSQHIVHRPTFTVLTSNAKLTPRQYARFWHDPDQAPLQWIAQLFMMLAMGVLFNKFTSPHELEGDSPQTPDERMRHYRSCAGWALSRSGLTQPNMTSLTALMLYMESHFIIDRAAQTNCYVLSGVCIRLMLKMGLHRDPSKLGNISPFEGEMRRRMWNMALQIDLLVSFHMGLPSMTQGIESDTKIPLNLEDTDFDASSTELPKARPDTDHTHLSYPTIKLRILKVFGEIAKAAHALTPPTYEDSLRLDAMLTDTWDSVPSFMKARPLDECIGDPPILLIQRFGIGGLYNKSRCVLHRRYLAEADPSHTHSYARGQCIDAALTLLDFQHAIWQASKPGSVLSTHSWFVASLITHDYLLAAVCLYLVVKSEHYPEEGCRGPTGGWLDGARNQAWMPSKGELRGTIRRSYLIWRDVAREAPDVKKTASTLAVMLEKLGCAVDGQSAESSLDVSTGVSSIVDSSLRSNSAAPAPLLDSTSTFAVGDLSGPIAFDQTQHIPSMGMQGLEMPFKEGFGDMDFDPSWVMTGNMDWRCLDVSLANGHHESEIASNDLSAGLFDPMQLNDMDGMTMELWNQSLDSNGI